MSDPFSYVLLPGLYSFCRVVREACFQSVLRKHQPAHHELPDRVTVGVLAVDRRRPTGPDQNRVDRHGTDRSGVVERAREQPLRRRMVVPHVVVEQQARLLAEHEAPPVHALLDGARHRERFVDQGVVHPGQTQPRDGPAAQPGLGHDVQNEAVAHREALEPQDGLDLPRREVVARRNDRRHAQGIPADAHRALQMEPVGVRRLPREDGTHEMIARDATHPPLMRLRGMARRDPGREILPLHAQQGLHVLTLQLHGQLFSYASSGAMHQQPKHSIQ